MSGYPVEDFAFTSCLCPAARNRPRHRHRTSENTRPSNGLSNGLRFVSALFEGRACGCGDSARKLITWISHLLDASSDRAPSEINLELAQRISSSHCPCRRSLPTNYCISRRHNIGELLRKTEQDPGYAQEQWTRSGATTTRG